MRKFRYSLIALCLAIALAAPATCAASLDETDEGSGDDNTIVEIEPSLDNFQARESYKQGMFTDVESTAWYAENVAAAYKFGLVKGTSSTTYNPTGNITLAETATIAARIYAIYHYGEENFTSSGIWYDVYVDYCELTGILQEGQFSDYNRAATRKEFASILYRALPDYELEVVNWVENNSIPDVSSDGSSEATAIYGLYRAGVLTGSDSAGTFNPQSTITRAEATAIITRIVDPALRKSITLNGEY